MTEQQQKKFNVLVVDPPWTYENEKTGGTIRWNGNSAAVSKYNTLSLDDLKSLKSLIEKVMTDDSVLFLWVTVPLLDEGFDLLRSWGYKYKTMITWQKTNIYMGYWFRGQTEHILLGVKGDVKAFRCQHPNIIKTEILKHSEKPYQFNNLIEKATKNMSPKYLEMFARRQYKNWMCIGNEMTGNDIRVDLETLANGNEIKITNQKFTRQQKTLSNFN